MWRRRIPIAAIVAVVFALSTAYVAWALKDLPNPNSGLAAGDIIFLDRNGQVIEDYSPAGHYHVNLTLDQMGKYPPAAGNAGGDRKFTPPGAVDGPSTARAVWGDLTS